MNRGVYLCGIGRMENHYIREWVEHYKSIGFDKIILYDNNYDGEDSFEDVIQDYINYGFVDIINYRNRVACQYDAYDNCYKTYSSECDWIAFFDVDEFLILEQYSNIHDFVSQAVFYDCDGIRFCWKNYNDSDLVTTNGCYSCKDRFTQYSWSTHCKSMFKTNVEYVDFHNKYISDAHGCYDKHILMKNAIGCVCNNTNNDIGDIPIKQGAWLNHYRYKTLEEFVMFKLKRCYPDRPKEYTIKKGFGIGTFFGLNRKTKEKLDYLKSIGIEYE